MSVAIKIDQQREEGMLGASEAAAALGMDPHSSPITPWRRLRGLPVDDNRSDAVREAMEWGGVLEPVVRGRYALKRTMTVVVPKESRMLDGWLRATPDGYAVPVMPGFEDVRAEDCDDETSEWVHSVSKGGGLVQIKTCSPYAWSEWGERPPRHQEIQCRVEMAVCDRPWNDLVHLVGGQRMHINRIERDPEQERVLLDALRAFWDMVQAGHEPNPDATQAWRDHVASRMKPTKVTALADDATVALVSEWRELRFSRKLIEVQEGVVKARLFQVLAEAGATALNARELGMVTAREVRGRVDYRGLARSLGAKPADEERFRKAGSSWSLHAPKEWSDDDED